MQAQRTIPGGGKADDVPAELRALPQWVGWKLVTKDGRPKPTKVPVNPATGQLASSTDYHTWGTFDEAFAGANAGRWDGVGFVFTPDDPYCGIDLDDVINPATGELDPDAVATVGWFDSYAELSPSGTGIHVIVKGKLPPGGRKRGDRECYSEGRFFTVTGKTAHNRLAVKERQEILTKWHAETFPPVDAPARAMSATLPDLTMTDAELVEKIRGSAQGPKFNRLWSGDMGEYGSGSEADLALCSILAWWTRGDAVAVDRLFRASGLARPKWDAKRNDSTYGRNTVTRAVSTTSGGHDPAYKSGPTATLTSRADVEPETEATADDVAGIHDLKAAGANVKWLWPGWAQIGVLTAIAAEGGTGKTRWAADVVRRIRHGLEWPDGTPMGIEYAGGTVALWVVSDNHHDEMVSLCESFGIADCVKLNAPKGDPYGGTTLDDVAELVAMEGRIRATRPNLVIIDTVGNSTDRNLSKQEDAKAYYHPLQVIARKYGCGLFGMTHLNAGGKILGRRALEKVRTCIRISAKVVNDTGCPRRLEVIKSNSKYPPALGIVMGDAGNEYTPNAPPSPEQDGETTPTIGKPATKTRECADWLGVAIATHPRRVSEIRDAAELKGFGSQLLYRARDLLKLEEVKTNGKTWWRMPLADDVKSVEI